MFITVVNDWEAWARSRSGTRIRHEWGLDAPALAGWQLSELQRPQTSAGTDAMQAALVALSQRGDSAAITTLLVQLRPGLGALAAWHARVDPRLASFDEAANEVRSTFYEVVMRHDLELRPAKIAANLLLDTRQKLWRATVKYRRAGEIPIDTEACESLLTAPVEDAIDELDLTASVVQALDDLGGSPDSRQLTAELAFRAWFLEEPSVEVACELGIARNAARTRLCRLRQAVRTHTDGRAAA